VLFDQVDPALHGVPLPVRAGAVTSPSTSGYASTNPQQLVRELFSFNAMCIIYLFVRRVYQMAPGLLAFA